MKWDHSFVCEFGLPSVQPGALNPAFTRSFLNTDAITILDIGANDGTTSEAFTQLFPQAQLHAFEPDPRALRLASERLRPYPRVVLHPVALSDNDGRQVFHQSGGAPPGMEDLYPEGWHLSGSLREPLEHLTAHPWCTFDSLATVETVALDTWAEREGIGIVDFIWMDVQGAEDLVIAGGSTTLARTRFLYTEYSEKSLYSNQKSLSDLLQMLPGWEIVIRYETDVLLRNTSMMVPPAS